MKEEHMHIWNVSIKGTYYVDISGLTDDALRRLQSRAISDRRIQGRVGR